MKVGGGLGGDDGGALDGDDGGAHDDDDRGAHDDDGGVLGYYRVVHHDDDGSEQIAQLTR